MGSVGRSERERDGEKVSEISATQFTPSLEPRQGYVVCFSTLRLSRTHTTNSFQPFVVVLITPSVEYQLVTPSVVPAALNEPSVRAPEGNTS